MRFCSLKFQNLVRKIDLVNRRWVVYSRAYGECFIFERFCFQIYYTYLEQIIQVATNI